MGGDEQNSSIGLIAFGAVGCRGKVYQWDGRCAVCQSIFNVTVLRNKLLGETSEAARSVHEALFSSVISGSWVNQAVRVPRTCRDHFRLWLALDV